jgi:ribonuclease P protein component
MPASGSGAPRRRRLSRSGDFKRAYREGSSKATRYLVLYRFRRSEEDDGQPRLGVTVSRKLGDSVTRNRIKRVLKEAFWAQPDPDAGASDYVLVARPGIGKVIDERGLEGAIECVDEVTGRNQPASGDQDEDRGSRGDPGNRST